MAKYEIDGVDALSVTEVADQLMNSRLEAGEKMGEVRLEYGTDLEIDILTDDPSDPRIDGHLDHTESFTLEEIKDELTEGEVFFWAKDENGEDVLLCRN